MPTPSEYITQIYAGYFNRAPDPEGLNYWVGRFNGGMSLLEIAQSFSVQPETTALYSYLTGGGSPASFLTSIYNNLLGRAVDPAGAAYWTAQLASNMPVGRIIIDIISGAQGNDALLIANKVAVGQHFVSEAQRMSVIFDISVAKSAYIGVSHLAASVTTAINAVNAVLPTLTISGRSTFVLTTGVDYVFGTPRTDNFAAVVDNDAGSGQTLTDGDTINGGGGFGDVLHIRFNPASSLAFPAVNITNIENISLQNNSGRTLTFDSASVVGDSFIQSFIASSDVNLINLAPNTAVNVLNSITGNKGSVSIGYAVTGGNGHVSISGGAGPGDALFGPSISFTSAPTSVIINSLTGTHDFNGIFNLDPGAAIQTLTINAAAPFRSQFGVSQDQFETSTMKTIIVTGGASNYVQSQSTNRGPFFDGDTPAVYLGFPDAPTIDASAMTNGGIEAYIADNVTENGIIKGGQGGDRIGGSQGNDIINGNGGNDTIYSDKGTDILTGGAGADRFIYDVFNYYGDEGMFQTGILIGDTITDFTPGLDKLVFSNGVNVINASTQQTPVQAAVNALGTSAAAAQIATAMATANTANNAVAIAVSGGDSYVYYEKIGSGVGVGANDVFIKLVGVTSSLTVAVVPSASFLPIPANNLYFDLIVT